MTAQEEPMETDTDEAIVDAEPEAPAAVPYRVIGRLSVDGVGTGGVVDIADPVRARRLVRSRLIDPIRPEPTPEPAEKPKPSAHSGARPTTAKEA